MKRMATILLLLACNEGSERQESERQVTPANDRTRLTEPGRDMDHKAMDNADMRVRTHCSLMGYRVSLLAAFAEKLGDRTLYNLDCSKQRMDCTAVTMRLEKSPNALDPSDIEIGSYRLALRHPSRILIEEMNPRPPVAKKTIIIDTDQENTSLDIIGQTGEGDWRTEVKCEEVRKSIPSVEAQLREQEHELGLSPSDPLVRPGPR